MHVHLKLHGGTQGQLDVLHGLVMRNERAIREGKIPMLEQLPQGRIIQDPDTLWRDAPAALEGRRASIGSLAAWGVASERAKGKNAHIAMVEGFPAVWVEKGGPPLSSMPARTQVPTSSQISRSGLVPVGRRIVQVGSLRYPVSPPSIVDMRSYGRSPLMAGPSRLVSLIGGDQVSPSHQERALNRQYGAQSFIDPLGMALSPGTTTLNDGTLIKPEDYTGVTFVDGFRKQPMEADKDGRTSSFLLLTLDDEDATPIREVGNAIAWHNASQIASRGLPPLYSSGVRYATEPHEIWMDYPTMLFDGGNAPNAHPGMGVGTDDCEGLAAVVAGEHILQGTPAEVWTRRIRSEDLFPGQTPDTGRMFHAVTRVELSDGSYAFDDPSARLGMSIPDVYLEYAKRQRAAQKDL